MSSLSQAEPLLHVKIQGVQGTQQTVVAGQQAPQRFVANVRLDDGTPVAGAPVLFGVRGAYAAAYDDNFLVPIEDRLTYGHFVGSPDAYSFTAISDANGNATAATFVAGALGGYDTISALLANPPGGPEDVDGHLLTYSPPSFSNQFGIAQTPPAVTLAGYMSGNWYDPTQAGQGFQLEFTKDNLLAIWFVYKPDGSGQAWIYAQGPYDRTQNGVTVQAEILTGAKFPPYFQSSDIQGSAWGTLEFAFTDCNHGGMSWDSNFPDYAGGSMPITRLTQIDGTSCPQ